jgi:hypothetical protein
MLYSARFPGTVPVRPPHRRRLALAVVALAWLAQQLGFAAHGPMQVGAALGGPLGEICTSAGIAPAPGDPPSPSKHRTQGADLCDLCTVASLPALAAARVPGLTVAQRETDAAAAPSPAPAHDSPWRANRSRAPPLLPA